MMSVNAISISNEFVASTSIFKTYRTEQNVNFLNYISMQSKIDDKQGIMTEELLPREHVL